MSKTRTKKAALNMATAALYELVAFICGLILPRLILRNFGSAYNGITSSAKQFLSAIDVLTLGVAGTTRVALYRSIAAKDHAKTCSLVRATEKYMRKIGLILAGYVLLLCVFYPLIVDTGYEWFDVAILVFAAGVTAFGQYFFGTAYSAFLSASQCVYITNLFNMVGILLNLIVAVILIKCGCSIQVVKLGSAAVMLARPLLRNLYVTKKFKLDKKCEPDQSALAIRKDVMAHSLANIVHDHTDIIVLTLFCNVKIVSVYTVYNLVMSALKKIQGMFTTGTEAVFGDMWAKGELDKIKTNLGLFEFVVASFVSVVFSTAMVMLLPFVSLYVRGVHDVEYIIPAYAFVITTAQAMYCLRAPYLTLVQGAGKYRDTKRGAYIEAGMNIVLSVVLVLFIGITGVAVGTLAANIFRTVQYALYIDKNIVHRGRSVFVRSMLWGLMNLAVVCVPAYILVDSYAATGWWQWILSAAGTGVYAVLVTLVSSLVFCRKSLKGVLKIARRAVGKRLGRRKQAA